MKIKMLPKDCAGGAEVAFDWERDLVLHENDRYWHPTTIPVSPVSGVSNE